MTQINIMNLIWLVLRINCVGAYIFYYEDDKKTYNDSLEYCNSKNGSLLRYGELFNKIIRTCEPNGTNINVWTGKPFYLPSFGCTAISATALRTPPINRTNDKHIAVCADFCNDVNFSAFSVQTDECGCYEQAPNQTIKCQYKRCPGNDYDICGNSTSNIKLYSKEYTYGCVYRSFWNSSSDGNEFSSLFNSGANCSSKYSYICQVGDSVKIRCENDQPLTTQAFTTITTGTTSLTSTVKPTSPDTLSTSQSSTHETTEEITSLYTVTMSQSSQSSTHETTEEGQKTTDGITILGVIIGVAIGGGLFVTLVIVVVCCKLRYRKPSSNIKENASKDMYKVHENDTEKNSGAENLSNTSNIRNDNHNKNALLMAPIKINNHFSVEQSKSPPEKNVKLLQNINNAKTSTYTNPSLPSGAMNNIYSYPSKDIDSKANLDENCDVYDFTSHNSSTRTQPEVGNIYGYKDADLYDTAAQTKLDQRQNSVDDIYDTKIDDVYDSAAQTLLVPQERDIDNIYDHNVDDVYDTSTHKTQKENAEIYDHT